MVTTHCLPAGSPWATGQIPCPGVNATKVLMQDPGGLRRGRMIYLPSTSALASQIQAAQPGLQEQGAFATAMLADSWQVVSVDNIVCYIPFPCVSGPLGQNSVVSEVNGTGSNAGGRFLATHLHYWDHIKLYCDQTFGPMLTFVVGYSWGAYFALAIALNRTTDVIGAISRCGPTIWQSVSDCPDWAGGTFTNFDIGVTAFNAIPIPVHLNYSSNDTLIGPVNVTNLDNIAAAAQGAGAPVTNIKNTNDHLWTAAENTDFESWVTTVLDPTHPAVH